MSFLSGLAKLGGGILAPFTGGASLALTGLGAIGDAASSASKGRADARVAQSQNDILRHRALLDAISADLAQRRFAQSDYQTNARNATQGGLLSGVTDAHVTAPSGIRTGTVTGGARPSAITDKAGIGDLIRNQAIARMVTPQALPSIPTLPDAPQAGKLDKFLNIFGTLGGLAGGLGALGGNKMPSSGGLAPSANWGKTSVRNSGIRF